MQMKGVGFVAMLYCMAAVALLLGLMGLYDYMQWRYNSHVAQMVLTSTAKVPPVISTSGVYLDVKYVEPLGETYVDKKWVAADMAKRMGNGEAIQVWFRSSNPMETHFSRDDLELPWGWLGVGVVLFIVAQSARGMLKKEASRA
jgi:hypothetical protein